MSEASEWSSKDADFVSAALQREVERLRVCRFVGSLCFGYRHSHGTVCDVLEAAGGDGAKPT